MRCVRQKPGKKGQGESGWTVQAKLDIYLWLGDYDTNALDQPYLGQLPRGWEPEYENDDGTTPPVAITYEGKVSKPMSDKTLNVDCFR